MYCNKCHNTGVIDTGNNDLPCDCEHGTRALFNVAGVDGPVTGQQVKKHFLNRSPNPIDTAGRSIPASDVPK
jgi:hypothetical protein